VRKTAVVKMINTEQPDVVGLQEPRTEQREYLKNNLRTYGFLEVPGTGTGTGGNTCLIYRRDRFTLVEDGYFYLSYTPDTASRCFDVQDTQWRTSVWVHLKETSTGKEFYFLSTHLPVRTNSSYDNNPYIEARKLSAQLDIDRMKSIAGENAMCFIVGDMNCSDKTATGDTNADGAAVLQIFKSWMSAARDLDMLKNVYSFNGFGSGTQSPARNLDHIYYRNATGIQFQTLTANYGVQYVSDHYPIMLTALF
jgi:endonuclease/exonuclease/phosphatase family metal-dependent hydrolase